MKSRDKQPDDFLLPSLSKQLKEIELQESKKYTIGIRSRFASIVVIALVAASIFAVLQVARSRGGAASAARVQVQNLTRELHDLRMNCDARIQQAQDRENALRQALTEYEKRDEVLRTKLTRSHWLHVSEIQRMLDDNPPPIWK
jgi:hypothetical protein